MRGIGTETKQGLEVGIGRKVNLPFDVAIQKIEKALQKEGFGVLTRIDVKETLKGKLGVDRAPFVILGACNPKLAHMALGLNPEVGLLLPCNVVVREIGPGSVRVESINPEAMLSLFPGVALEPIASEARAGLTRAIDSFDAASPP